MYRVILLCFFVSFCSCYIINSGYRSDVLNNNTSNLAYIRRSTFNINNKIRTIMKTRITYSTKLFTLLGMLKITSRYFIEDKLVNELNETRAYVDAAAIDARAGEYCYVDVFKNLEGIRITADNEMYECDENVVEKLIKVFSTVEEIYTNGYATIDMLNQIEFSCMWEVFHRDNCITSETEKTKLHVNNFYTKYRWRIYNLERAFTRLCDDILLCYGNKARVAEKRVAELADVRNSCATGVNITGQL